jgi:hypothetical protein
MNRGNRITEVFCFICLDPDDNNEGIPAIEGVLNGRQILMPLVGADFARLQSLIPAAKDLVKQTGKPMRLAKFKLVEEMGDVKP